MKATRILFYFLIFLFSYSFCHAQTNFHKYYKPVLTPGEEGAWDSKFIFRPRIIWDETKYMMFYSGGQSDDAHWTGLATSSDGINWERYEGNPVLVNGYSEDWDSKGKIEPSNVIFDGSQYKMWYDIVNLNIPTGIIGYATSSDGINWIKDTLNSPVIESGENDSDFDNLGVLAAWVILEDTTYKMWYSGVMFNPNFQNLMGRIGYAESNDGISWKKNEGNPILEEGDYITWGNDFNDPCVIFENDMYHMWYFSNNTISNRNVRIEYITSSDGINWDPSEKTVVLKSSLYDYWSPSVIHEGDIYKMWYIEVGDGNKIIYAEDFSDLVHADSVMIDGIYHNPSEPVSILGRVVNPEGHALTAKAMLISDDGTVSDSVQLMDDGLNGDGDAGDGIYGGSYDILEKTYTVGIKTVDQVTGFTRNGLNWSITDRFTSKGPIEYEIHEITNNEPISGERFKFSLTLKNMGVTHTVNDVDVRIILPDTTMQNTTTGVPKFGDIAPGESLTNWDRDFAITLKNGGANTPPGQYEVGLEIMTNREVFWYDSFVIDVLESPIDVNDNENIPIKFNLEQNFPNPFNPSTDIKYSIPNQTHVKLKVFDVLGREVATLVNKEQAVGTYSIEFDASSLTSGIYFYKIQAGDFVESKKMVLMK